MSNQQTGNSIDSSDSQITSGIELDRKLDVNEVTNDKVERFLEEKLTSPEVEGSLFKAMQPTVDHVDKSPLELATEKREYLTEQELQYDSCRWRTPDNRLRFVEKSDEARVANVKERGNREGFPSCTERQSGFSIYPEVITFTCKDDAPLMKLRLLGL